MGVLTRLLDDAVTSQGTSARDFGTSGPPARPLDTAPALARSPWPPNQLPHESELDVMAEEGMRASVVYESMYGNTHLVADVIGEGPAAAYQVDGDAAADRVSTDRPV